MLAPLAASQDPPNFHGARKLFHIPKTFSLPQPLPSFLKGHSLYQFFIFRKHYTNYTSCLETTRISKVDIESHNQWPKYYQSLEHLFPPPKETVVPLIVFKRGKWILLLLLLHLQLSTVCGINAFSTRKLQANTSSL